MSNLTYAIALATNLHDGQFRKKEEAGLPYICHPLRVMLDARYVHDDIDRMAAVLHDVVEDTVCTLESLRLADFPEEVVDTVDALTRRVDESYKEFIERAAKHPRARRIKMADICDNNKQGTNKKYNDAFYYLQLKQVEAENAGRNTANT